jgi:two-component system chemotaxis response regulator CheB
MAVANRDVVAIGTSAGGVEALLYLVKHLPKAFPASILVTIHLPSQGKSALDEILTRVGPLSAQFANDGEVLRKGHIYIAPQDRHLLLDGNRLSLGIGPRENNSRPAIDPMLRSAAVCCCARAIGVVLTGTLGDGASGMWALERCGGITVVQDPNDAAYSEMPQNVINRAKPDHIVKLWAIPALLENLVHQPAGQPSPVPYSLKYEVEVARTGRTVLESMDHLGKRSVIACPDCGGVTWEIDEGDIKRFRCHVGHTCTAETMNFALDENLRRALASAQRALEERVALARKLEKQAVDSGHRLLTETWTDRVREYDRELKVVRGAIQQMEQIAFQAQEAVRSVAE